MIKKTMINTTSTGYNIHSVPSINTETESTVANTLFSGMNKDQLDQYVSSVNNTKVLAELHRLIAHHTGSAERTTEVADLLIENLTFQIEGMLQDIEYLKADVIYLQSFKSLLNNKDNENV